MPTRTFPPGGELAETHSTVFFLKSRALGADFGRESGRDVLKHHPQIYGITAR